MSTLLTYSNTHNYYHQLTTPINNLIISITVLNSMLNNLKIILNKLLIITMKIRINKIIMDYNNSNRYNKSKKK